MKPKEYLFSKGMIEKVGKGRLSREHVQFLKDEAAKGVYIEGYSLSVPASVVKSDKPKAEVSKEKGIVDIGPPLRDEDALMAVCDGKEIGMRTICNTCHSSLTYCGCQYPKVNIDHEREGVVVFKPRTTPNRKRWY